MHLVGYFYETISDQFSAIITVQADKLWKAGNNGNLLFPSMNAKVCQSVAGITKAQNATVYSRAMMTYGRVEVQLHAFLK